MTKKKRNLTEEDQSLWEHTSKKVKPLPKEKKPITPHPSSPYRPLRTKPDFSLPPLEMTSEKTFAPKGSRRIERVKKVDVEARLDLHGLTLEQARLRLAKFLIRAQENHYLWVLIITGKGRTKLEGTEQGHDHTRKTLRDHVPQWLEEPILRSVVSAYSTAKPQDGGNGALYVRLKRPI